jgi:hypothetical protein
MDIHLVVVKPFAGLARGDVVTDGTRVAEILGGELAAHVVRVAKPSQQEG